MGRGPLASGPKLPDPRLEAMVGRDGSADDIAQEASIRALAEAPKTSFEAWLWIAARNLAIDWLRKRGREVTNAGELLDRAIATPRWEGLRDSIQLRQGLAVLATFPKASVFV